MSGAEQEPIVRSAVPIPDLSIIDAALRGGNEVLKEAVVRVRPARAAHPALAGKVLGSCDPAHSARILGFMPTDHQVAILAAMAPSDRGKIEGALDPADKAKLQRILAYGETAVARLMTPKIWTCERSATVGEALSRLREDRTLIEVAQNCYVVEQGRLVGVVPLREMAVLEPATSIESVMTPDPIAVSEETERGDAAEIIQTHDFLSLPVIDKAGQIVGAVRVDDLLDAALSKVGAGILNQGGVVGKLAARLPYFQTPMHSVVRSRLSWLVLLFVAETATGTVLRHFEDELTKVVALSFFVPLLIGTGGNAGSQTVSTIIRALALGEVRLSDALRVLAKEASTGLALGVLLGLIAFGRATMWGVGYDLAGCVGITVLVVCTWANTVGAVIPLAAQRVGIDPTVVSGPLITTLVDASGLFIYLTIARFMIAQLHG